MVLSLVSPLLDGPFLISPSRRQSTTPGESHTRTRSSLFFHQGKLAPPVQLWPHGCLRDAYEARSPLSSRNWVSKTHKYQSPKGSGSLCLFSFSLDLPAGLPASRSRYISTHRVSTYDPLARRSTPSLDSRLAPDFLSILSGIYIVIHMDPPRPFSCVRPAVSTVSHAYPYGLICAAIGSPRLLTGFCSTNLRQGTGYTRLAQTRASLFSAPSMCLAQRSLCHTTLCLHGQVLPLDSRFSTLPPVRVPSALWYLPPLSPPLQFPPANPFFSETSRPNFTSAFRALPTSPSGPLPYPVLFLPSSLCLSLALRSLPLARCPSPTPTPLRSLTSPPPAFCLGIHCPPAILLPSGMHMQPSL